MSADTADVMRPVAEAVLTVIGGAAQKIGEKRAAASLAAAAAVVLSDMSDADTETWIASVRAARAEMRKAEVTS